MNVLVTGGLGFMGSAFVRQAVHIGQTVVNVDHCSYAASFPAVQEVADKENYHFEEMNIGSPRMQKVLAKYKIDTIVNFAAETHVDNSIDNYVPFVQSNIVDTCAFLHTLRWYYENSSKEIREKFKFVHLSTDEVYGEIDLKDRETLFVEGDPYHPNSPYSASKAAGDHMVGAYVHTWGLPCMVVHPANNYGPWQYPEKLIPKMVMQACTGQKMTINGTGFNVREWIYVDDCARAIWTVLLNGTPGEHYNVGSGQRASNRWMVQEIIKILGQGEIIHIDDRPGNDSKYALDSSKLRALGWKPEVNLRSGLEATVKWHRARYESL